MKSDDAVGAVRRMIVIWCRVQKTAGVCASLALAVMLLNTSCARSQFRTEFARALQLEDSKKHAEAADVYKAICARSPHSKDDSEVSAMAALGVAKLCLRESLLQSSGEGIDSLMEAKRWLTQATSIPELPSDGRALAERILRQVDDSIAAHAFSRSAEEDGR